jgi:plasmid stability protein
MRSYVFTMVALRNRTCYNIHRYFLEVISMPTLHVRNIPDELYERIRNKAQANQRSISAEVVVLLNQILAETWRPQSEVLASIKRRRFFRPAEVGAPDSVTLLRQDRER